MSRNLSEAVADFMGPLVAEYGRLISEYDGELPVIIKFGGYEYRTQLSAFQDLDKAFQKNQEQSEKAAATRRKRKASGTLI